MRVVSRDKGVTELGPRERMKSSEDSKAVHLNVEVASGVGRGLLEEALGGASIAINKGVNLEEDLHHRGHVA